MNWRQKAETLALDCVRDFIDGRWQTHAASATAQKFGPRDGALLYRLPLGGAAEADRAVASARVAFEDGRWSRLPLKRRQDVLLRLASLIEQHREELALLECLDVGKPIHDAFNFDLPAASDFIRYCAQAIDKLHSKLYWSEPSSLAYELRRPVGVVVGIVGWNFPLDQAVQKMAPALAMGNTLVLKPSECTSLSAARLAELAVQAGVPPGVFNVVHGNHQLGAVLAYHRDVDLLSFTGSTRTGRELLLAAGNSNMKRLILECGGKAPNLVFEDCPGLDAVAEAVMASAFWNQGQVCVASSRLLVEESIKESLLEKLTEKALRLVTGDPLDPSTRFGALVSRAHSDKVASYINEAERTAHLVCRGPASIPVANGFYVAPHIFDQVTAAQKLAQEEVFGPVLAVLSFRDEAQAVAIANDTIYGLSAILWTRDLGKARRVAHEIRAGSIIIHATDRAQAEVNDVALSLGGHKQSGLGVEGGLAGLEAY
jgi:acyl-CoA reductase-like NAD-dependent aldehyde dehydrogenase